ncbi:hypothetical protein FRB96_008300 [Tulasnella sp. 330]|nr:hypothetical protein FRB96_008300 [Tulasnella sp. 330]KAG8886168.1 hypothetical protein FRB97_007206 [Tulasnella sp. 331]KAG8890430.1 hypothetical protein FRB98_008465 [Tulasnella sp. 332]
MSNSTGVFYAYAKHINDDWSGRYLITFANRDVADTWYRAITDSVARGYQKFAAIRRISPQWYTHDRVTGSVYETITDPKVASTLLGRVFFTLLHDRDGRIISTVPVVNSVDHINGARFYIRSVPQPDTYWFYEARTNAVVASRRRRTRFTITIADKATAPGAIITSSDDVYITKTSTPATCINFGIADDGRDQLCSCTRPFVLKFSSFATDFEIEFDDVEGNDENLGPISHKPGQGERWELA